MKRHVHLDPVGGIAGDMFVSAMLDTMPDLQSACWKDLADSGVLNHVHVSLDTGKSHGMAVKRFSVSLIHEKPRATGHYSDLKLLLQNSELGDGVLARALSLLELLAHAESQVHGVAIDDVHFHEVADWDSIADIVAAASIIEHSFVESWSCSQLPTGSGLVKTEHGMLPVPAPATAVLLEGLVSCDDGEPGERVTPTGAAIARHLLLLDGQPRHDLNRASGAIVCTGMGAGQRSLTDRPNILRCTLVDTGAHGGSVSEVVAMSLSLGDGGFQHDLDTIAQLNFAIDDMSSEEVAIALQYVRQSNGVVDVSHSMSFGKKGRMMFDVTVLCLPQQEPEISRLCFSETSTLGVRVQLLARRVLRRKALRIENDASTVGVKVVHRPAASSNQSQQTSKVESDDLRRTAGLYARRERARELTEAADAGNAPDSQRQDS